MMRASDFPGAVTVPPFGAELVTRTKFIAPTPRRTHLDRERLYARLDEVADVALGLVVAGTGYGKSSLLAGYLRARAMPALWYELAAGDADPQLFAIHLAHLVHRTFPGAADRALALLAQSGGAERYGEAAVDALADALLDHLQADTWLVLDDFHLLTGSAAVALVDRLVTHRPPRLHIVLAARTRPDLPGLPRWRLQDEVVALEQAELAFDQRELTAWLEDGLGLTLGEPAVAELVSETEGWPMALALVARRLRERPTDVSVKAGTRTDLFEYLAREVLEKLEAPLRDFLLGIAPLTRLDPGLCETISGRPDAGSVLRELDERGLFLIPLDEGAYRLHHLFREFLLARLAEAGTLAGARRVAGAALLSFGRPEDAIEQWLGAGDVDAAAGVMALLAPTLVSQGRFAQLTAWIQSLPAELMARAPALAVCQGDACRLAARFDESLGWYERALIGYGDASEGRARALAGQALVFLDTLQPARAAKVLQEAIALAPAERRPELLMLLAENKLNEGDAAGALALFPGARARSEAVEHEARVRLRTGRLADARAVLRPALEVVDGQAGTRAHREPALVLALIEALEGDAPAALGLSNQVLARARGRESVWTEAVAHIRLGHAQLVAGEPKLAEAAYREAIARADEGGVARLKAEPLLGLALIAGRRGDLQAAEAAAGEALEVTRSTGDVWVSAMLELGLGGAYSARGDERGAAWLARAQVGYEACGDAFGRALVALGLARLALARGDGLRAVRETLAWVRTHDFGCLLTRPTLLGFADAAAVLAFFQAALAAGLPYDELRPWVEELGIAPDLAATAARVDSGASATPTAGPVPPAQSPGETAALGRNLLPAANVAGAGLVGGKSELYVHTLGGFRVRRGDEPLGERAWGREKARQLFQLLVTFRGQRLVKGRIIDLLWPDLDGDSADGIFRVALNALNKALEPDRPGGTPTRFIVRDGATYGLGGVVDVDATAFERLLDASRSAADGAAVPLLREALALYEGPFLPDADHPEALGERERLAERFTDGAIRLARALARLGDDAGCAEWAQRLIARDRCAEEAYRLLMAAQYRQGDRGLAIRTYDRCVVALSDELDVDPLPETQALYQTIASGESVSPQKS